MEDKKSNKLEQLQDAIENEAINRELKDYVSRLQEKLRKVRSFGGNFRNVDFSPYVNDIVNGINGTPSQAVADIQEINQRSDRGNMAVTVDNARSSVR